ncbi:MULTISPECIES: hypothetical protein [unclassified Aureispira]|uniref:hypothetical protein n=1 Tax=unclassified Aureispira TaxID=2649989 RepID=UPI000697E8C6|nr:MULTISPECIES: hypothetical protein [unclassified Aureispira]WMX15489.1 hypothetical protein QP953_03750 [Aureispira sp. CCB-E]
MFRLFGNWNTYLTKEIREGKHLDKAQKTDCGAFFDKSTFKRLSEWTILWVDETFVYWAKADQEKLDKYCFFKTSKKAIEQNFAALDVNKKKSLLAILISYISAFLDEIDGCIYTIEGTAYDSVQIAEDTNFKIRLNVDLRVRTTSLEPVVRAEKGLFELLLHPHNFDLIKIERLD